MSIDDHPWFRRARERREASVEALRSALGRRIAGAVLDDGANHGDGALHLTFDDGKTLELYDDASACCERRYMTTDDDLSAMVGATFLDAETREGLTEHENHEVQFLVLTTSQGEFTLETHDVHDGNYGLIDIRARWLPST